MFMLSSCDHLDAEVQIEQVLTNFIAENYAFYFTDPAMQEELFWPWFEGRSQAELPPPGFTRFSDWDSPGAYYVPFDFWAGYVDEISTYLLFVHFNRHDAAVGQYRIYVFSGGTFTPFDHIFSRATLHRTQGGEITIFEASWTGWDAIHFLRIADGELVLTLYAYRLEDYGWLDAANNAAFEAHMSFWDYLESSYRLDTPESNLVTPELLEAARALIK